MTHNYPLYPHSQIKTMKELLAVDAEVQKDKPAFIYPKSKKEDITVSHRGFKADVEAFGTWLYANGYQSCHIAVYGENSYDWILTHFAVTCGGNVIVPIDKDLPVNEAARLINDRRSRVLVYSDGYSDEVSEMALDGVALINMKDIASYIAKGNALVSGGYSEYTDTDITPDMLATIVYTSGTTGTAKGVMLTHGNLAADTVATCETSRIDDGTVLLLPLHHTFGLVAGVTCVLLHGHFIYINKSLKNVSNDLLKAQPEHLSLVPMVIEGLYKRIWDTAEKEGKAKALKLLIKISNALLTIGIDVRRRLFKSVLTSFGGRLQTIVSGGANIEEKYIDGFKAFGITIVNGYGITECGPVVATNRNKAVRCGTVGFPLKCNEVRIDRPNENGEGEILVKGSNVMVGYYNNPEATKAAFDGEWFKTGDIGKIDNDGYLYVTGRIKNLIILSNGKNISPEEIEDCLHGIEEITEVIVYAENDALIAETYSDSDNANIRNIIDEKIQKMNKSLPPYKQIAKTKFRETEFEKTTTKKIKR
jgi:long-chain acyl-CoA synthetase